MANWTWRSTAGVSHLGGRRRRVFAGRADGEVDGRRAAAGERAARRDGRRTHESARVQPRVRAARRRRPRHADGHAARRRPARHRGADRVLLTGRIHAGARLQQTTRNHRHGHAVAASPSQLHSR